MQKDYGTLTIIRETRGKLPSLPFLRMKNEILGKDYELSLVFVGRNKAIELHKQWKQKNDPVNILSFPLSSHEGEIIISLEKARRECRTYDLDYENYLGFLFIHGCVHLLGYDHSDAMEKIEETFRKKFGILKK